MAILYVWSGAAGTATGASWVNAKTTLVAAFTTEVAGDTIYVAHDHAESNAAAITLTSSGTSTNITKIICVDRGGTVPPVAADRRTTAQVTTTTTAGINFQGHAHYDGIIFNCGTGANAADISLAISGGVHYQRFDNCSLRLLGTGAASSIDITSASFGFGSAVDLNNTTLQFSAATHTVNTSGKLIWRNTPSALLGTMPTTLFTPAGLGADIECSGVDLSATANTIVGALAGAQGQRYRFVDCKLNASATKSTVPASQGSTDVNFIRCGATGVNYTVHKHAMGGLLTEETTIVRTTGGASDGTTPLSWKVVTTTSCSYSVPFECPVIAIWNDTTGSAVTATVEGIGAALPTDAEVWLDVEYLGDASSPVASFVNDGKPDLITTAVNQTSSSETWGGSTAAFKLAVTFTAAQAGFIYARVKIGKASTTAYIDPLVTLS